MDKKNTTIGVLLLIAAFASMYIGQRLSPPRSAEPLPTVVNPATQAPVEAPVAPTASSTLSPTTLFAVATKTPPTAETVTLQNEFVAVDFTTSGGAVRDIAFKKYPAVKGQPEPYVFNALHADPMLAFVDFPGLDRTATYEVVSQTSSQIVFRATFNGRVEVTRRYSLVSQPDKQHDPYVIRHETTFRNLTTDVVPLPRVALSLGTSVPTSVKDDGLQIPAGIQTAKTRNLSLARSSKAATDSLVSEPANRNR